MHNPPYSGTFVFYNDFAALLPDPSTETHSDDSPLLHSEPERGICPVICFSPRHDLTLPELDLPAIENVLTTWAEQSADLGGHELINYVQVFENRGGVMGCSNPHPHSQVWASGHIPNEPSNELASQADYFNEHHRPLLADYLAEEHKRIERILAWNDHFSALVPFWAVWPFETLLIAHRPGLTRLTDLTSTETPALNGVYSSNVPQGSGLSSSASVEMAFTLAWRILGRWTLPPMERSGQILSRSLTGWTSLETTESRRDGEEDIQKLCDSVSPWQAQLYYLVEAWT